MGSVKAAEMMIAEDPKAIKEYLGIDGLPEMKKAAQELIFSAATLSSGRVASCQALSGTGALRVAGEFLNSQLGVKKMYQSEPTWGNHVAIFKKSNMQIETYPYYHEETRGFDFDGMIAAIKKMEPGSAILLHANARRRTICPSCRHAYHSFREAIIFFSFRATAKAIRKMKKHVRSHFGFAGRGNARCARSGLACVGSLFAKAV